MTKGAFIVLVMMMLVLQACSTQHAVDVAPVRIEPIHITIDVNIKVDRALDDFFADIDEEGEEEKETTK